MSFFEARVPMRDPDHSPEGQRASRKYLWDLSLVIGAVVAVGTGAYFFIEDVPPIDPVGKGLLAFLAGAVAYVGAASVLTRV